MQVIVDFETVTVNVIVMLLLLLLQLLLLALDFILAVASTLIQVSFYFILAVEKHSTLFQVNIQIHLLYSVFGFYVILSTLIQLKYLRYYWPPTYPQDFYPRNIYPRRFLPAKKNQWFNGHTFHTAGEIKCSFNLLN